MGSKERWGLCWRPRGWGGPDFLSGIGDFAVDEDMAKLTREVKLYVVFQSEVSGAEFKHSATIGRGGLPVAISQI